MPEFKCISCKNGLMYQSGMSLMYVHKDNHIRREGVFIFKNYQGNCLLSSDNKLVILLFFQKTPAVTLYKTTLVLVQSTHLTKRSMESSSSYPNNHLHFIEEEFYSGTRCKLLNVILYTYIHPRCSLIWQYRIHLNRFSCRISWTLLAVGCKVGYLPTLYYIVIQVCMAVHDVHDK